MTGPSLRVMIEEDLGVPDSYRRPTAPVNGNALPLPKSPVVGTIPPLPSNGGKGYPEDALDPSGWTAWEASAFHRVFLGGEPGPKTASEDDQLLALLIIKGGIRDEAQVEELMRHAAIARVGPQEKWTRNRQYISRTIRSALRLVPATLAKALASSAPKEAAQQVQPAEPPQTLGALRTNAELLKAPAAIASHLAWAGRLTGLAGREGCGKSTWLTAAACAVSQGQRLLDESCPTGSVLWISLEEHPADLVTRLVRFGGHDERIHIAFTHHLGEQPVERLVALVRELRPTLTVLDSLHKFAASTGLVTEGGSAAQWQRVLNPLLDVTRETETAFVVTHHATKSNGKYRDSTAIGATVDVMLEMQPPKQESGRRVVDVAKARWPLSGYTIEQTETHDSYRLVGAAEMAAQSPAGQDRQQLFDAMGETKWLVLDLSRAIGWSKDKTRDRLEGARVAGLVDRTADGPRGAFVYWRTTGSPRDRVTTYHAGNATVLSHDCGTAASDGEQQSRSQGVYALPF